MRQTIATILVILGSMLAYLSFVMWANPQISISTTNHQFILAKDQHPSVFFLILSLAAIAAVVSVATSIHFWVFPQKNQNRLARVDPVMKESPVWIVVNIVLIISCGYSGYISTGNWKTFAGGEPTRLQALIPVVLVPVIVLAVTFFQKDRRLLKPSLSRSPFRWEDPLEVFFIATLGAAGATVGSWIHLATERGPGVMAAAMYASIVLGLIIGQVFVYWHHSNRIFQ